MSWLENSNIGAKPALIQAIDYSLNHTGKRLRPRFVEEASAIVNLDPRAVENTATAIEMVHIFSLVHDDLPCMDNDDFRRGLPTTHKKFGEAQGLLAGDALLSMAYETFAKNGEVIPMSAFLPAFRLFSECIGPKGMILGQSLELEWTTSGTLTLSQLIEIQKLKTGALFRASILTPLLLAGAQPTDALYLECLDYADAFGFAFQIADDLDDEVQDQAQQKKNVLSLMGRKEAVQMAIEGLQKQPISARFSNTALLLEVFRQKTHA
jgi:geranylgeranyl diphosphate synthase type II